MKGKNLHLIFYWLVYVCGLASYVLFFEPYGMIATVMTTLFSGLGTILIANAMKNRLLILLGVVLILSPLIVYGIYVLLATVFGIDFNIDTNL
ncbi:hypothetical protein [Salibacterium qingdaonense]|uniref:Uncharacterized protein n=1 Tax=Salibacterium qingdaonense TaxID=266892 RepID=A0A1I4P4U3_9BACI|nr:hypothetical protein [Salibacterium qingdaonense]SFM22811.1 hypothetical protein SAMN04488054_12317 [Salibacterium qingdaonense]